MDRKTEIRQLLKLSPDQVIGIVEVYRLNSSKLKLGPGAIAFRIRQGVWPANGVLSPEEAQKHSADEERSPILRDLDKQHTEYDPAAARGAVKAAMETVKNNPRAEPEKPKDEPPKPPEAEGEAE